MSSLVVAIESVLPGTVVHARLLLVEGKVVPVVPSQAGGTIVMSSAPSSQLLANSSGRIQFWPLQSSLIPPQQVTFDKRSGVFKALLPLVPGENSIHFYVLGVGEQPPTQPAGTIFSINYSPQVDNPPLQIVFILGKDSQGTYDDAPDSSVYQNCLDTAVRRLRIGAYLWQAYTQDEMQKAGLGFRTFRVEESYDLDSISRSDVTNKVRRSTATIKILRSQKYTVADIRDPNRAQQVQNASQASSLFDIAAETLKENNIGTSEDSTAYVAAMFLDAHAANNTILGHAALGGGTSSLRLAIFGSHTLFAWPTHLEDIEACFSNAKPVDTRHCGIDGEGRCYFSACSVGIGAMMHEVGHLFGCPHQENGVMLRDYPRLHRSFTVLEPPNAASVVGNGVCHWHRLDLLRFSVHPCFKNASDPAPLLTPTSNPTCLPTHDGILLTHATGIRLVQLNNPKAEFCTTWVEIDMTNPSIILTETTLRERLRLPPNTKPPHPINLTIMARNGSETNVNDVFALMTPETLPGIGPAFKTPIYGGTEGTYSLVQLPPFIAQVVIHAGGALDGIEFFPASTPGNPKPTPLLLGTRGGSPHVFPLAANEFIVGFHIRTGAWVDAVQVITNQKRSELRGNVGGGEAREVLAPYGHRVCAVLGHVGSWMNGFGFLYCKAG